MLEYVVHNGEIPTCQSRTITKTFQKFATVNFRKRTQKTK